MDYRTLNFDWNRARAFLVAAEEGSFSAASRALGLSQPTVSRQVSALEAELGVALFERVGGGLALTEAGHGLVEHVRAMGEAASRVSLAAAGRSEAVEGIVAISASDLVSTHLLPPVLARLRSTYPGIYVDLVSNNQASDLLRREADIAVRNFPPKEPDLLAKNLGQRTARMYASRAYIERVGPIDSLVDLQRCEFFGFERSSMMIEHLRRLGLELTPAHFPIMSTSSHVHWALCKQDAGVCFLMEDVRRSDPDVVALLPHLLEIGVPMWLTCHRELRTSRRIRVVFDAIAEALAL